MKDTSRSKATGLKSTGQVKRFKPDGWDGNPQDYEAMATPFSRAKANQDLVAAISNHLAPGTTGDVVVCSTMINHLSVMERAFRARHTLRRCRATAHVAGRLTGHGNDKGPFIQLGVEYARALLASAKKPQ